MSVLSIQPAFFYQCYSSYSSYNQEIPKQSCLIASLLPRKERFKSVRLLYQPYTAPWGTGQWLYSCKMEADIALGSVSLQFQGLVAIGFSN